MLLSRVPSDAMTKEFMWSYAFVVNSIPNPMLPVVMLVSLNNWNLRFILDSDLTDYYDNGKL